MEKITSMKYVILADTSKIDIFGIPRQLIKINGEPIIKRTIRLLKENGIKDIIITSHDKRFDELGAKRYEPKFNDFGKDGGYWLSAFPIELLNEPICFIFGDVYFSEFAIKTIVETNTNSTLFFCTYENKNKLYIKSHDEPLAYKVVNFELFKEKIQEVKDMRDKGMCWREPIVWELYRVINGLNVNEHILTDNYVAINDESCDIDWEDDIDKMKSKIENKILERRVYMFKLQALENFTLERFNELKNIQRAGREEKNWINKNDIFECEKELADYLLGANSIGRAVVKLIEIEPTKVVKEEKLPINQTGEEETFVEEEKPVEYVKPKKNKKHSKK